MRVFVTHHKTGHHLCVHIARPVAEELGLTFYDLSSASEVPDDADVIVFESRGSLDQEGSYAFASWGGDLQLEDREFKGVHVIRHPYEIIASAYRWHQQAANPRFDEEWEGSGKSYREHLKSPGGVAFEMRNISRTVIMSMYRFPFSDTRFMTLKLEDFEQAYAATVSRIAQYLEFPEELMLQVAAPFDLTRMTRYPKYVTRKGPGTHSHRTLFGPEHYRLFRELFPEDLLARLGYES